MSQTATSFVYTGPWINWSHGLVLGSTITLNQQDGALLTAFLGIFVTTAGAACWKLMSFALHQHRSLSVSQDGIHHQQQVILRNTGSPEACTETLYSNSTANSSGFCQLCFVWICLGRKMNFLSWSRRHLFLRSHEGSGK